MIHYSSSSSRLISSSATPKRLSFLLLHILYVSFFLKSKNPSVIIGSVLQEEDKSLYLFAVNPSSATGSWSFLRNLIWVFVF
ncbi:hypothetical protein YC2023_091576 [Brassica napus]